MKHTIVVIGWLGLRKVYVDVPIEQAIERFEKNESRQLDSDDDVRAFTIDDEFAAYDVWPLSSDSYIEVSTRDNPMKGAGPDAPQHQTSV